MVSTGNTASAHMNFDENSSVVLTNTGTGSGQFWTNYVVADAVKFEVCRRGRGPKWPRPV